MVQHRCGGFFCRFSVEYKFSGVLGTRSYTNLATQQATESVRTRYTQWTKESARHRTATYCIGLRRIVLHCTALCCTILYNTVLCCTAHQRDAPQYKRCTVLFQYILNNTSRIISGPRRWISCPANFDNQVLARIRVWTRRWGSNRAQWPCRGSRYTFLPDILGARVKFRPNPFPWGGGRLV